MKLPAFVFISIFSSAALAQQPAPQLTAREYLVKTCSNAANLAATIADASPTDENTRAANFKLATQQLINNDRPYTPTQKDFDAAFAAMNKLVTTQMEQGSTKLPQWLKERILSESAANCMAIALGK